VTFPLTAGRAVTYEIDDNPARVDVAAAIGFLTTQAYWGRHRGAGEIARQIAGAWRVVGAYDGDGAMVGFARAFSDGDSAYLTDVYVLPGHRGHGLGRAILRAMIEKGDGARQRWMLHTTDAHGLYRQFGFAVPRDRYLERPSGHGQAGPGRQVPGAGQEALTGTHVRLEPLGHRHVPGLLAAAAAGGDLYRWTTVPQDEPSARRYVETAVAGRDKGAAVPFAVIRAQDGAVIGSTRFWNFGCWGWQPGRPDGLPDTCEIGHTWLSADAIRTAANTEMKTLMLAHAFETWLTQSVCLHTDARNQRSRAAIERIGARFEGILRAHRLGADGTPRDSARFSITAQEWPEVKDHLAGLARRHESP
jgi:RimJ/RimL family protein N-acetyltransferase